MNLSRVRQFFRFLVLFTGLLLAGMPFVSANSNVVKDVFFVEKDNVTKIIFNLKDKAQYKTFRLTNPNRIVVDLKQTQLQANLPKANGKTGIVRRIRSAQQKNNTRRFVIDTQGKVQYETYQLKPHKKFGHRLVVALNKSNKKNIKPKAKAVPKVTEKLIPKTPVAIEKQTPIVRKPTRDIVHRDIIIAIDAGHGGQDPGATGKNGTREKDVVLRIARKMKEHIDRQPGMRAILIRDSDHFIVLRDRIKIARKAKADMFLSVHADAYQNRNVRGSSVYVLSERGASDEASKWLANQENAADLMGGVSLVDKDETLARVLLDLSQSATIDASSKVADSVLTEIRQVAPVHKNSVQYARFVVLKSPDIPSILVETAFISNPREERRLNDAVYQNKLAKAMTKGIRNYFSKNPLPNTSLAQVDQALKVRPGDTLSDLAQVHRVSIAQLKRINNLKTDKLTIGQTLRIPF